MQFFLLFIVIYSSINLHIPMRFTLKSYINNNVVNTEYQTWFHIFTLFVFIYKSAVADNWQLYIINIKCL